MLALQVAAYETCSDEWVGWSLNTRSILQVYLYAVALHKTITALTLASCVDMIRAMAHGRKSL